LEDYNKIFYFRELSSFLTIVASNYPDKTAMIWEDRTITYEELLKKVSTVASSLRRSGIRKGDRVGTLMKNSPEIVYIWLGSLMNGSVFVPYNTALKGNFLGYQIIDSNPEIMFCDAELISNIPAGIYNEKKVVVNTNQKTTKTETLDEFMSLGDESFTPEQALTSDPAEILYTSGTTGQPKGVVLPHYSFINRAREVASIVSLRKDDVLFNCLPLFHTSGQVMTTLPALLGGLTSAQMEWFHLSKFWRFASETKSTISFLLMRMVNLLLKYSEKNFVQNNLRAIMCGGVGSEIQRAFSEKFGVELIEGYGMTETCGIAIFNRIEDNKQGSIGKPLGSVEVKLVDELGNEVGSGKDGEIAIREKVKNTIFLCYLNHPAPFDKEGWFLTGDIAKKDNEGYFYYVERKKDIIRSRGENIIPSQIESVAELYPDVVECAATSIFAEDTGDEEILLAVKAEKEVKITDFVNFLRSKLPFYMVPRFILFLDSIPKTANQKVKRNELKKYDLSKAIDTVNLLYKERR
jgi:crotonobetaine/carnitine-CoA ligase